LKKGKRDSLSWRDLLINKAFDLLMVIIGVTIAFQLNSLKQDSDQRSLERFYLESLVSDLDKDILEYEDNVRELRFDYKKVYSWVSQMERTENASDSLGLVVLNIMSIKTFEGHKNTYSTILASNGLSIIENPDIRNLILDHYRLYASLERFENNYLSVISRIHDYFSQYLDYNHAGRVADKAILKNIQTKNLLTISTVQLQGGIWRYEESLNKAKALRDNIKTILEK
jgi:hypothetical protein